MIYLEPILIHLIICFIWIVEEIPESWGITIKPFGCGYCMNFWAISTLVFFRFNSMIGDIVSSVTISVFTGLFFTFMTYVTPNLIKLGKDFFIALFYEDYEEKPLAEPTPEVTIQLSEDDLKILKYYDSRAV